MSSAFISMDEATSLPIPPMELHSPGEEPYVLDSSLIQTKVLLPFSITTQQKSAPALAIATSSKAYVPPSILPVGPARTIPDNQYPMFATIVEMEISPKRRNSWLVGGCLGKEPSNGRVGPSVAPSVAPSESGYWTYQSAPCADSQNGNRRAGGYQDCPTRPKHNVRSPNPAFIQGTAIHDSFSKVIWHPPHLENASPSCFPTTRWAFVNTGQMLLWMLVDITGKIHEPILRLVFANLPTCHTHCQTTKSPPGSPNAGRLDMMVGFNTGEVVW